MIAKLINSATNIGSKSDPVSKPFSAASGEILIRGENTGRSDGGVRKPAWNQLFRRPGAHWNFAPELPLKQAVPQRNTHLGSGRGLVRINSDAGQIDPQQYARLARGHAFNGVRGKVYHQPNGRGGDSITLDDADMADFQQTGEHRRCAGHESAVTGFKDHGFKYYLIIGDQRRVVIDQTQGQIGFSTARRTAQQDCEPVDRDTAGMDKNLAIHEWIARES